MNEKDLMLTQEDYEAMGLTPEQIELFEDAKKLVEYLYNKRKIYLEKARRHIEKM